MTEKGAQNAQLHPLVQHFLRPFSCFVSAHGSAGLWFTEDVNEAQASQQLEAYQQSLAHALS